MVAFAPMLAPLDHYRLLGRSGLRVSPICLGAMTFGEEWGFGAPKDECGRMLDAYAERGGNFIDTANVYTGGASETILGELLSARGGDGGRDRFVLATKYAMATRRGDPNSAGNQRKNVRVSLEASLRRLRTDYVDLFWVHAWDGITPIDEVMRALDDAVRAGKVLHVGVSDMPAWKVAQANAIAELRGWSPFCALQIEWSLLERTVERDLVPMARDLGLAVAPWGALGGGLLTGKYGRAAESGEKRRYGKADDEWSRLRLTERSLAVAAAVAEIARDAGLPPAKLALAWLLAQPGCTSPIIGARTATQLVENLDALAVELPADVVARLDAATRVDPGFPHAFLATAPVRRNLTAETTVTK